MELMLGNQIIAISSFFQSTSIFDLKPIKCRLWIKMDQCEAVGYHLEVLTHFRLFEEQ